MKRSDEHLVELFNSGDEAAFNELYQRYMRSSYNFALRTAGSRDTALDAYQSVWIKIVDKCDDFVLRIRRGDPPFVFKAYFFAMLRNAILDKLSNEKADVEFDEMTTSHEICNDENLERKIIADASIEALLHAIDNLPLPQKETFLLIKECGLSLKEVAEIQGISIETAKTRRRYAYDKLKPLLEMMH